MDSALKTAVDLAKKERSKRKGRQSYSDELKDAIRAASQSHTKSEIGKQTGISFPTLQKIIGKTRKSGKTGGGKRRASRKSAPSRKRAGASTDAIKVQVSVRLPSGAELTYSDLKSLRDDAATLAQAAKQVG